MVGVSQRLMTHYETQGGSPSPDLLIRFAEALEVSVPVLMGPTRNGVSAAPTTPRAGPQNRPKDDRRSRRTLRPQRDRLES